MSLNTNLAPEVLFQMRRRRRRIKKRRHSKLGKGMKWSLVDGQTNGRTDECLRKLVRK